MDVLQVAHRVSCTEAEGPGRRYALWLQGCPLRCPGCCNPEFLPFTGGESLTLESIQTEIENAVAAFQIEGISLLGGEPTSQVKAVAKLSMQVRERGLSVMLYSGYTLNELNSQNDPAIEVLLAHTDILVDGRYDRTLPELRRRWIGSSNQQVHFLSERYRPEDDCWRKRNTIELRLSPTELSMNGFPATSLRKGRA